MNKHLFIFIHYLELSLFKQAYFVSILEVFLNRRAKLAIAFLVFFSINTCMYYINFSYKFFVPPIILVTVRH